MSSLVPTEVYMQIKPKIESRYNPNTRTSEPKVVDTSVVATTKNRPSKPQAGCLLVKVKVYAPQSAFLPFVPEAIVTIPEDMAEPVVRVNAVDPREEP